MGQGIAQVALQGGLRVVIHDARKGGAADGIKAVGARLDRLVEKERISEEDANRFKLNITAVAQLEDLADCDVVIEAVFEDLDLKRGIFSQLEETVSPECLLASNTSSLLIASLARGAKQPQRIAGMHFFNPVPLMKLVEIVRGPDSDDKTVAALTDLAQKMGRTPVVVADAPGFLVNHGGRAFTVEAMRILHEGVATPAQIDAIMRDCWGYRMGPCELMDLTGVDVNLPVSEIVAKGFSDDPRLKTSFPHRALFEAGRLGRKTGRGHYRYDENGKMIDPPSPDFVPGCAPAEKLFLGEAVDELLEFAETLDCKILFDDDGESPILAAIVGEDCSNFSARTGIDYRRLVCAELLGDTTNRVTLATTPGADHAVRDTVAALIVKSGRAVTLIKDSPGFIGQRISAMVANLGCELAQIGIAPPREIDTAMKLGLNYPKGPLELTEELGPDLVMGILQRLQVITGEDRYRPSLWLKRRALLGLSIYTEN
ncbi:MAG TPA: 3-hydroxyacyl-CoA dehydrogenase [Rhizobiales bacterium]|nr:3-hydroxyacyl-CoA dehydrogenase [Hyphomicrobiales bacterium]